MNLVRGDILANAVLSKLSLPPMLRAEMGGAPATATANTIGTHNSSRCRRQVARYAGQPLTNAHRALAI